MDIKIKVLDVNRLLYAILFFLFMANTTGENVSTDFAAQLMFLENDGKIKMVDLDECKTINVFSPEDCVSFDYLFKQEMVFWTNSIDKCIQRALTKNGSSITNIVTENIIYPNDIAVDWIYDHIYWIDKSKAAIEVAEIFGPLRKILIKERIQKPNSIALNPLEGWMIWSEQGTELGSIERCGMDGKDRKKIIQENIIFPFSLTIDFTRLKIYWTDIQPSFINSANFDGTGRENILPSVLFANSGFANFMTVYKDWIYLTNYDWTNISKINEMNDKNLSIICDTVLHPTKLRIYHPSLQPDGINYCGRMNGNCSHLCLPSIQPQRYSCACTDGFLSTDDERICQHPIAAQLFFSESGQGIKSLNLQNCEIKIVVKTPKGFYFDYFFAQGIVIWTNWGDKRIQSALIKDGSPISDLFTENILLPHDIAVDWIYSHIYWIDEQKPAIEVGEIFGPMRKILIHKRLQKPKSIAVNPLQGWMIWSELGHNPKIERCGMDGKDRKTIIRSDIFQPYSLTIDFNNKRIYWSDISTYIVNSADFDGNKRKNVLPSILFSTSRYTSFLTVYQKWIYLTNYDWENISKIHENTDKNFNLVCGKVKFLHPARLRIYHPHQQPDGINYCGDKNGHCSHLCLPSTQSSGFSCVCLDDYSTNDNGRNCYKSNELANILPLKMKEWIGIAIGVLTILIIIATVVFIYIRKRKNAVKKEINRKQLFPPHGIRSANLNQSNEKELVTIQNSFDLDDMDVDEHLYEEIIFDSTPYTDRSDYLIPSDIRNRVEYEHSFRGNDLNNKMKKSNEIVKTAFSYNKGNEFGIEEFSPDYLEML